VSHGAIHARLGVLDSKLGLKSIYNETAMQLDGRADR
jgi:hypothetical protein